MIDLWTAAPAALRDLWTAAPAALRDLWTAAPAALRDLWTAAPAALRDHDKPLLLTLVLCLWGCALIPRSQTECSATRPCPEGQACDQQTSTCAPLADQGAPGADLAEQPCVGDAGGCVACSSHKDCPSQVCDVYQTTPLGGRCVPAGNLIYVDNHNGTCGAGQGGDGTAADKAVCTIGQGLALLDGVVRTAVRVMASTKGYGPVSVSDKAAALYGPAGESGAIAQLGATSGVDGISVSGRSNVIVDGFFISGSRTGVVCNGPGSQASLRLRRSLVIDSTNLGVLVTECVLEIDRVLLFSNDNGALAVGGGQAYSVTNTFIVKNQSDPSPAITILGTGAGAFRFNTVADNTSNLAKAAMDCGGQQLRIEDSIFLGNPHGSGSQFQNGCKLTNTVVGTQDNAPGGIHQTPQFNTVGGISYGLKSSDPMTQMCCIDRAMGTITMDYFGNHRPLGMASDIGAHEAR